MLMPKEGYRNGRNPVDGPLQLTPHQWPSAGEIPADRAFGAARPERCGETLRAFGMKSEGPCLRFDARQIIKHSGVRLRGSILEFDVGTTSIGTAFPDFVAIDNDPGNVKHLRRMGMRAIVGTIERLPIPENSFDYVLAFSPQIARGTRGWKLLHPESQIVEVTPDYKVEIVKRAIAIAKKKVLIASIPIAKDPPFIEKAEKVVADPWHHFYYVVYAGN
jgi:hypothetical protein